MQEISKRSVVNLVDLAGSERAAKTGNTGEAGGGTRSECSTRLPRSTSGTACSYRTSEYLVFLKYLADHGVS